MIALIDGDILCYRIGFATQEESQDVAIRTMASFLEELVMFELNVSEWNTYLTGPTNFRNDYAITAPYKGNRKGEKPTHHGLLREYLELTWTGTGTEGIEADDAIAIDATTYGDESIIVSLDKDFDQVQGWHYNFVKKEKYYVQADEGLLNFYMQFLVGDRIDNIIGVKGIGPVKARKILTNCGRLESDLWAAVVEHLGEERALENGRLLYLRRKEDELWNPPTTETSSPIPSCSSTTADSTPPSTKQEA